MTNENKTGWQWPVLIVGALALSASLDLTVAYVAAHEPGLAPRADYAGSANTWDADRAAARQAAQMGYRLSAKLATTSKDRRATQVLVQLRGAQQEAIDDAEVRLVAFHRACPKEALPAQLTPAGDGSYVAELPMQRLGLWQLDVSVRRGDLSWSESLTEELRRQP